MALICHHREHVHDLSSYAFILMMYSEGYLVILNFITNNTAFLVWIYNSGECFHSVDESCC